MKRAIVLLSLFLCGCHSLQKLPPISADAFEYSRNDPAGGTKISAKNIKTDGAGNVTAEEVTWDTTYPAFGVHIKAVGYKQEAKK
jgi:hypothetical protein